MNDLTAFQAAGLPANVEDFRRGLQQAREQAPQLNTGVQYLKMNQVGMPNEGMLTYGAEGTEVEEGSEWVVNVWGMQHGFILRDGGSVNGEVFDSITNPLPQNLRPVRGNEQWKQAYKCQMVCVSGEDRGVIVEYSGDAGGVVKLFKQTLLPAIERQLGEDPESIYPALTWEITSYYSNKQKKEIYEAHATIVGWLTEAELGAALEGVKVGGDSTPRPAESDEEEEPAPPKRRAARTRASAAEQRRANEPKAKAGGRGKAKAKEEPAPSRRRRRA